MEPTEGAAQDLYREHLAALDILRFAKNVFLSLALISVFAHVGSWYVVRYTHWMDASMHATTVDADAGITTLPTEESVNHADRWRLAIESALAVSGFVGRVAVIATFALFVLGLLVSLSARLGGAAGMAKACVWSLLALAALVPWDRMTAEGVSNLPAAFYSFHDLISAPVPDNGELTTPDAWMPIVRFAVYPMLVALALVAAQVAFRSGYLRISSNPPTRLPVREV